MNVSRGIKESFTVIGKEGSTRDGEGFIQRLWADANANFSQVAPLAKKDENGSLIGIWGAMTDVSRAFLPWEDGFSQGLYLAGVECEEAARAPEGWVKWVIPGFEYVYAECTGESFFGDMLRWLEQQKLSLAGAVQDFTCPKTGKNYMFFPIRKL